jgi:hypothetical protein
MALVPCPLASADIVIDTNGKISSSEAQALRAAGVTAIWRYVFFGSPRPGDIDSAELNILLNAGLTVLLVQHVRNPGWMASPDQGTADGRAAVANAIKAGYVGRVALALDLEGVRNGAYEHAVAWCAEVRAASYRPVVYVGYSSGMAAAQLDALGPDVVFWADFAPLTMRPHPARGYALHQHPQSVIAGVAVDVDEVLIDGVIYGLASVGLVAPDPGDPVDSDPGDHAAAA